MEEQEKTTGYKPKIVGFVCNWCTYAGADMAGMSRMEYPANIRLIRMPCTGRMNPMFILKAFERGADGVLVSGCHPASCHYNEGNYYARRKIAVFRKLLEFAGVDPRRFWMSWVSASEGRKFADLINEMVTEVAALGPYKGFKKTLHSKKEVTV